MSPGVAHDRVAFIIPARNEDETIASVIDACVLAAKRLESPADVIVVSDGSMDKTVRIARSRDARCVDLAGSSGSKARAMQEGSAATCASILIFVDADCIGLNAGHLVHLLALHTEHQSKNTGMVVGVFDYKLSKRFVQSVPWSTGQRVMHRNVFEMAASKADAYDIEIAINETVGALGLATISMVLNGVRHRTKVNKMGLVSGTLATLSMWRRIAISSTSCDREAYKRYARNVFLADTSSLRVELAPAFLVSLGMILLGTTSRVLGATGSNWHRYWGAD